MAGHGMKSIRLLPPRGEDQLFRQVYGFCQAEIINILQMKLSLSQCLPTFNSPNCTHDLTLSTNIFTQHINEAITQNQHLSHPLTQVA